MIPPLAFNAVPNHGVAQLKGYLEPNGHEVVIRDLDKELYVPEILDELRVHYLDRVEIESVLSMPTYPMLAGLFYPPEDVREVVKLLVAHEALYDGEELDSYVDSLISSRTTRALEAGHRRWTREILGNGTDVVALSVGWQSALPSALRLARDLKAENPDTLIIAGGFMVHDVIAGLEKIPWIDCMVVGEGELAFEKILQDLKEGKRPPKTVQGTPMDINELPFPDFDGFDLSKYRHVLPSTFSRGCIYKCRFCFERSFWPVYRRRKPEVIVREIKHSMDQFGCDQFFFTDSLVNGDINVLSKTCDMMKTEELDVFWGGQASTRKMSGETLRNMASAGAGVLYYGIESASKKMIESMGKGTDINFIREILKETWEAGIWTLTYWIFGFPGEGKEDLEEDYRFLEENRDYVGSAMYHRYELLKGSEVYANQDEHGVHLAVHQKLDRIRELRLTLPFETERGLTYRQSLEQEVYARNVFNPRNHITSFPPFTRDEHERFKEKRKAA